LTSLRQQGHKATAGLYTDWLTQARAKQLTPQGDWNIWLILAGRGWGKTRTGATDALLYALRNPESQVAIVTPTFGDLRRVAFEGPSGILKMLPKDALLRGRGQGYNASASEIRLYNGSKIMGFSASEPDRLRGPQFHRAWCDELAAWRYPQTFDQLMFGLRLGHKPQCIITTTPKPTPIIRTLMGRDDCIITTGSTFENSDNLAASTLIMLKAKYEGTTLGRQELYAEVIDATEGALWTPRLIEDKRIRVLEENKITNVLVALDPAVTSGDSADETGIVVVGKDANNEYYVLEDKSGKYKPDQWGRVAIDLYYQWDADRIVAEVNNGGDLVKGLIRNLDPEARYKSVHATRGKMVRAEPVAALYEQGRVHHVGVFPELETQMCTYTGDRPKPSPDRLDALVWGLSEISKSRGEIAWRVS
jgi:phage terminase large subunit-like protein